MLQQNWRTPRNLGMGASCQFCCKSEYQSAGSNNHHDWRLLGWLLHVAGWLLVASAIVPAYRREASRERDLMRRPLQWAGVLAAPLPQTAVCFSGGGTRSLAATVGHLAEVVVRAAQDVVEAAMQAMGQEGKSGFFHGRR